MSSVYVPLYTLIRARQVVVFLPNDRGEESDRKAAQNRSTVRYDLYHASSPHLGMF